MMNEFSRFLNLAKRLWLKKKAIYWQFVIYDTTIFYNRNDFWQLSLWVISSPYKTFHFLCCLGDRKSNVNTNTTSRYMIDKFYWIKPKAEETELKIYLQTITFYIDKTLWILIFILNFLDFRTKERKIGPRASGNL